MTVRLAEPLAGFNRMTVTDAGGTFQISNIPLGAYELHAELDGFAPRTRSIDLASTANGFPSKSGSRWGSPTRPSTTPPLRRSMRPCVRTISAGPVPCSRSRTAEPAECSAGLVSNPSDPAVVAADPDFADLLPHVNLTAAIPRARPRTIVDVSVGRDFMGGGRRVWSVQAQVTNLTTRTALYNFQSVFVGTRLVQPRTCAVRLRRYF